jgi:radical SAM-linked protein
MPIVTKRPPPETEPSATAGQTSAAEHSLRIRYRIRFAKTGLLRWISHRDLARLWERLLRRADLRLSMTEGFHPKPRIGFPSALALGVEGLDEVVEIELAEELTPADLLGRLRNDGQPGLSITSVCRLPEQFGKAQLLRSDYVITLAEPNDPQMILRAIEQLMAHRTLSVQRKNKTLTVDVASQIPSLELRDAELHLSLAASQAASLRPTDVLNLLGLGDWIENGSLVTRVRVALQHDLSSDDPAVVADAPQQTGLQQTGLQQTGLQQAGLQQAGPQQAGPQQAGPQQAGPSEREHTRSRSIDPDR